MSHKAWLLAGLLGLAAGVQATGTEPIGGTAGVERELKQIGRTLEQQTRAQELATALGRMQVAVQELGLLRQELRIARSEADRAQAEYDDAEHEYSLQQDRALASNPGLPRLVTDDMLIHLRYRLEVARNRLPGVRARLAEAEEDVKAKQVDVDEWRRVFDALFRRTGR